LVTHDTCGTVGGAFAHCRPDRGQTGAIAGAYLAGHTPMVGRDAVGVIASIAPWNHPLTMMAW